MKVRFPKWDYGQAKAHWAPYLEYVQARNAASTIPSYVEPYLMKVMTLARKALDERGSKLDGEIAIFIQQEVQHCKQHNAFNKRLREEGYGELAAFENELKHTYDDWLKTRSLQFHCAYAEGFEALGSGMAPLVFEGKLKEFEGEEDSIGAQLWRWHLAEEFEHRTVAFDVYQALYARKRPVRAYFYRLYGFFQAVKHLGGYSKRVTEYLLSVDRAKMTDAECEQSLVREKHFRKRYARLMLPKMLAVLSPFYNPGRKPVPQALTEYLESWDAREAEAKFRATA